MDGRTTYPIAQGYWGHEAKLFGLDLGLVVYGLSLLEFGLVASKFYSIINIYHRRSFSDVYWLSVWRIKMSCLLQELVFRLKGNTTALLGLLDSIEPHGQASMTLPTAAECHLNSFTLPRIILQVYYFRGNSVGGRTNKQQSTSRWRALVAADYDVTMTSRRRWVGGPVLAVDWWWNRQGDQSAVS